MNPALSVRPSFKSLKFGYAGAEDESSFEPMLLLDGFFDPGGCVEQAKTGHRFLFLGYKGSGKSAISEHLRLSSEGDSQLFVTSTVLADFPYTDFAKIVKGDAEAESRLPTAWSWLILLALFSSFTKDEGSSQESPAEFYSAVSILEKSGLLPAPYSEGSGSRLI